MVFTGEVERVVTEDQASRTVQPNVGGWVSLAPPGPAHSGVLATALRVLGMDTGQAWRGCGDSQ